MKNTFANLEFLPAVTTYCDWLDKVSEIIDSAKKSVKIYWKEGFWFGNFLKDAGRALMCAHERGAVIEIIAGPIWLSVLSYELNNDNSLFGMVRNGFVDLYCLDKPENKTRFIIVDEVISYFFEHSSDSKDIAIQPIKFSLQISEDTSALNATFEKRKSALLKYSNPEKHLLVLEAFEYDHIRQLGLLEVSHQEIYHALEEWEREKRKVAHSIAESMTRQISDTKEGFSQEQPTTQ